LLLLSVEMGPKHFWVGVKVLDENLVRNPSFGSRVKNVLVKHRREGPAPVAAEEADHCAGAVLSFVAVDE